MMDIYPREKQGKAMAMWGVGTMVGPILGPSLGGWLTDEYSWRWVFYINLPVGILCAFGIIVLSARHRPRPPRPFDMLGFALLAIAIGTLPAHARPRPAARLVRFDRDHRRDRGGGPRLLRCSSSTC